MAKVTRAEAIEANLNEQQKEWWTGIKNRDIEIYGLKEKKIGDFASPMNMEPESLYLTVKAPAAVPAIELALANYLELDPVSKVRYPKFSMEMADKYLVVRPTEGKIIKNENGKYAFVKNK